MALKGVSIWGCSKAPPPLQLGVVVANSHSLIGNLRYDFNKWRKWECCCIAQSATTAVTDESLPKPLCDESKAVELWSVDKVVLPIENYVSGSIHYNYDLLLRHRLHMIGEDDDVNVTRFLVLAKEPIIAGTDRPHKTSIVFILIECSGVLFKALAAFALRDINLSKRVVQHPLRVVDDSNEGSVMYFDYLFYIDIEASMAEPRAQHALGQLQELASFLGVLGCYPIMDTVL